MEREGEKPELNIGTIAIGKFGALTGFRIRCALERRCSFVVPLKASMKGPCLAHGPRAASARGPRPRGKSGQRPGGGSSGQQYNAQALFLSGKVEKF